ncbi:MAG TPA: V-type ATP synthase subunit D [Elusimicrobiales bacterium]|nr:V-type ATP synthase subunit D [Elusimicrobiales bacterium]
MALMEVPATKSALLALRRQLAFAEEGYELLERKRELLLLELAAARGQAAPLRAGAAEILREAFSALRGAELSAGGAALDRAAPGAPPAPAPVIKERRLMGVKLPSSSCAAAAAAPAFGPAGVPCAAAAARRSFNDALPLLAALAGLDTCAARLALEMKKTQRRCNALSKKVIPDCRETALFLAGTLEDREREALVVLKLVRNRLRSGREGQLRAV